MSLDIGNIRARLSIDHSEWRQGLGQARGDLRQFGQDASAAGRDWNRIGQDMARMGSTLSRTVTPAMLGMGAGMLKVAGDTEAATARMGVTFAGLEDDMMGFLTDLQQIAPAAMAELQNSASSAMGALVTLGVEQGKANEMTKEALEVANALAAHMDIPFREALERVSRGYAGNTQGLRDMAFAINQADINARALELGLEGVEAGAYGSARAIAVHSLVMEQMDGFMHAAEARVGTFNFELRQLWATLQDTAGGFGEIMLPAATQFVTFSTLVLEQLRGLDEGTQRFVLGMGAVAAAMGPALLAIGKLISMGPMLRTGWAFMIGPAAPFVIGATALAAGIYLIATNWDEVNARLPNTIGLLEDIWSLLQKINDITRDDSSDPGLLTSMAEQTATDVDVIANLLSSLTGAVGSEIDSMIASVKMNTDETVEANERAKQSWLDLGAAIVDVGFWAWTSSPRPVEMPEPTIIGPTPGHAANVVEYTDAQRDLIMTLLESINAQREAGRAALEYARDLEQVIATLDENEAQLGLVNQAQDILRAEIERTGDPTRELTSMMLDLNRVERDLQQTIHEANLELAEKILALQDTSAATQDAIEPTSRFEQTLREGELAAHSMGGALNELASAAESGTDSISNLAAQYDLLHGAVDLNASRMGHWEGMLNDAESAVEFLKDQIKETGDPTGELTEKLALAEWGVERFGGGVHDLRMELLDSQLAVIEYHQLHDELARALDEGKISPEEYAAAVDELNEKFLEANPDPLAGSIDDLAEAISDLVGDFRDLLIEIGILDEVDPEVSISVEDQEAIERTATMQDRADTLDDTDIHLVPTVDETQAVDDILFLEQNIDNIPDSTETVAHFDASQPNQELPRLRGLIDGIPKSFTITPSVNLLPALNSFEVLRANMPSSPAEMGPFSVEPNWDWLFQGLSFSAEEHTEKTIEHLQQLADRIRDAWSGPSASSVAGAIVQGLADNLNRLPGMISHITPEVLVEFEIMRAGIMDQLTIADIVGDQEKIDELKSELNIIREIAVAWAKETGISMGQAFGGIFDADHAIEELHKFFDEMAKELERWSTILSDHEAFTSGEMHDRIEEQIADLDAQIEFARRHDAPPWVIERLIGDRETMVQELHEATEIYRAAIEDGLALSPGALADIDFWTWVFGEFDDIMSGDFEDKLETEIQKLRDKIVLAEEIGTVPEQLIEEWRKNLAEHEDQLTQLGEMHAEAYKAGLIPGAEAISDEHFDILHGMLEDAEDISSATVNAIIDAWRDGRMEFEQVARLLPESAIPHLQRLQQAWADEMVQAIVNGNEELYRSTKHWFDEIGFLLDGMSEKVVDHAKAWEEAAQRAGHAWRGSGPFGGGADLRQPGGAGGGFTGPRGSWGDIGQFEVRSGREHVMNTPIVGGVDELAALLRASPEYRRVLTDRMLQRQQQLFEATGLVFPQQHKSLLGNLFPSVMDVNFDKMLERAVRQAMEMMSPLGPGAHRPGTHPGRDMTQIHAAYDALEGVLKQFTKAGTDQFTDLARAGEVANTSISGLTRSLTALNQATSGSRSTPRVTGKVASVGSSGGGMASVSHGGVGGAGAVGAGTVTLNQTFQGVQAGDVQRETQRALRITATNWGTN